MQCFLNLVVISGVCLVVTLVTPIWSEPNMGGVGPGGEGNIGRPSRPQVFSSPEELRTYLEQLGNYFAIAGRPRFGKRLSPTPQQRPSLKKLLDNINNNNNNLVNKNKHSINSDDTSNDNSQNPTLEDSVSFYHLPSTNSELYQLLYQYDE